MKKWDNPLFWQLRGNPEKINYRTLFRILIVLYHLDKKVGISDLSLGCACRGHPEIKPHLDFLIEREIVLVTKPNGKHKNGKEKILYSISPEHIESVKCYVNGVNK